MLKQFMFASIGVLALALAFHLGARSADAEGGGSFAGIGMIETRDCPGSYLAIAIASSGDLWISDRFQSGRCEVQPFPAWRLWGTIPGGVAVQPSTWGQIKARAGK